MSLNATPSGERVHIGIFGRRNAGKSQLINALTGQKLAIVSDVAGTTTDPVSKAMELLPIGPVMIIDTPGLDDEGELCHMRVEKTLQVLAKTDIALVVIDAAVGMSDFDRDILARVKEKGIPHLVVYNKSDLANPPEGEVSVSAVTGEGVHALREKIAALYDNREEKHLVADLVSPNDVVILVVPIDASAPKGRLILPQQQVIRDLLEAGGIPMVARPSELTSAIESLKCPPRLVITDSQAFGEVAKLVPESIPLTSFSMVMARYKGNFAESVAGAKTLDTLNPGDRVLIAEGCTHHRQCEDIGTVKLPNWIRGHMAKLGKSGEPEFSFVSGGEFPEDLSGYALVIHCGACMLNEREVRSRYARAAAQGVSITNYGIAIAHMHGILARAAKPLL
ncbi:MAG: [Clostridia bacterium]|nr:[FeFe] hydrogenase H-cluster maturation GTPase HydF [Clostridia bacterium]